MFEIRSLWPPAMLDFRIQDFKFITKFNTTRNSQMKFRKNRMIFKTLRSSWILDLKKNDFRIEFSSVWKSQIRKSGDLAY